MSKQAVLPEVAEYLEAQERLSAFKAAHYDLFAQFAELTEQRDTALENADKAVKASGKPNGPWKIHRQTTSYDAEKLYEEIGREDFLKVGGKIETRTVYELDVPRIEAAIAKGDLPDEVVNHFRQTKIAFTGPKKSILP